MGGSMTFREALWTRLNIIKPTLHQVCSQCCQILCIHAGGANSSFCSYASHFFDFFSTQVMELRKHHTPDQVLTPHVE